MDQTQISDSWLSCYITIISPLKLTVSQVSWANFEGKNIELDRASRSCHTQIQEAQKTGEAGRIRLGLLEKWAENHGEFHVFIEHGPMAIENHHF